MSQLTFLSYILQTYYLATTTAAFHTILEAEEQQIDKGLNTLEILQSIPPFTYHMVYQNEKIRPPFMLLTITSKGRDSVVKPSGYVLYFFTCHHCLNILIYTFKCTGKSSSICMTARDYNDEGFSSITIPATFDKLSKRMSLYGYV